MPLPAGVAKLVATLAWGVAVSRKGYNFLGAGRIPSLE